MNRCLVLLFLLVQLGLQAQSVVAPPVAFQADSVFLVRTKGPLAYLNYGLGQDRLGGAKFGYLDSLVLLKVVGQHQDLYQVQLSANLTAWIPKLQTQLDSTTRLPVQQLTGSWRVWGQAPFDYVGIQLPERLPYQMRQEINPSRVVIDLFGATANTNWITQLQSAKEIQNVDYEQVSDSVLRVTIYLKHRQHWGNAIGYQNKRLVVKIKQQPTKLKLSHLTVAIDAGHGGSNLGARGLRSKQLEKDLNLIMAKHLQAYLQKQGAKTVMTRQNDTLVGNNDRLLQLRNLSPDLLVSIHNNAAADTVKVRGTSTYYKHLGYRPLSQAILKRVLQLGVEEYGNVGRFNFTLNAPSEYPNVLIEGLFLSHPTDEALLLDDAFRQKMAKQIGRGIKDWLKATRRANNE
jgi:N-acetylmuramoyl-L-alanine amidase